MTLLTNEDKVAIINQHKRNIEYTKYGVELSLAEENSIESPSQNVIDALNIQISDLNNKIALLDTELSELQ